MCHARYKIDAINYIVIGVLFLILFLIPAFFTRINGEISWKDVLKIWGDLRLLLLIFVINHWLLAPQLMLKKKYVLYFVSIISIIVALLYINHQVYHTEAVDQYVQILANRPTPIPPYAHVLMFSLLITSVDTGLLTLKKWNEDEARKHILEKNNAEMRLNILTNQVSPHFLMNTLNNLFGVIDENQEKAKSIVLKLSKLMRYMLYESEGNEVPLSREFDFIESYVQLMKMRFDDKVFIRLSIPQTYEEVRIPPLLFISFIENAFKYGVSYENRSIIEISFRIEKQRLIFYNYNNCYSSQNASSTRIGISNTVERLKLLYGPNYHIDIKAQQNTYKIMLSIPLYHEN